MGGTKNSVNPYINSAGESNDDSRLPTATSPPSHDMPPISNTYTACSPKFDGPTGDGPPQPQKTKHRSHGIETPHDNGSTLPKKQGHHETTALPRPTNGQELV